MKVYLLKEIERIEKLPEFKNRQVIAQRAQRLSHKGIARKRQQTRFLTSRLTKPQVPVVDLDSLVWVVGFYYMNRYEVSIESDNTFFLSDQLAYLLAVKCLMHYDGRLHSNLSAMRGLVGAKHAAYTMQMEMLAEIKQMYPELEEACAYCQSVINAPDVYTPRDIESKAMFEIASSLGEIDNLSRASFDRHIHNPKKCA